MQVGDNLFLGSFRLTLDAQGDAALVESSWMKAEQDAFLIIAQRHAEPWAITLPAPSHPDYPLVQQAVDAIEHGRFNVDLLPLFREWPAEARQHLAKHVARHDYVRGELEEQLKRDGDNHWVQLLVDAALTVAPPGAAVAASGSAARSPAPQPSARLVEAQQANLRCRRELLQVYHSIVHPSARSDSQSLQSLLRLEEEALDVRWHALQQRMEQHCRELDPSQSRYLQVLIPYYEVLIGVQPASAVDGDTGAAQLQGCTAVHPSQPAKYQRVDDYTLGFSGLLLLCCWEAVINNLANLRSHMADLTSAAFISGTPPVDAEPSTREAEESSGLLHALALASRREIVAAGPPAVDGVRTLWGAATMEGFEEELAVEATALAWRCALRMPAVSWTWQGEGGLAWPSLEVCSLHMPHARDS